MAHSERCADFHVPFLRCESERAMCVVTGTGAARSESRTSENHQGKRCLNYISQQQLSSDLPIICSAFQIQLYFVRERLRLDSDRQSSCGSPVARLSALPVSLDRESL